MVLAAAAAAIGSSRAFCASVLRLGIKGLGLKGIRVHLSESPEADGS